MNISGTNITDRSSYDALDDGWDLGAEDRIAAHRLALLKAYFATFGLWDESTSEAAARSVVLTVLRKSQEADQAQVERRLIAVARSWVREFSQSSDSSSGSWLARAPSLLSKFPAAFLATPLPAQV